MATYIKGNAVANATSYELLEKTAEGVYNSLDEKNEINFEVSALGLTPGDHTLVVKAKADGYEESDPSNEVVYTVAAEARYLELPATYNGEVTVEQNPEVLYYGTHNIFALPGIAQGTFEHNGVTITVEGSRVSVKGTSEAAFYFNLVTGEVGSAGLATLRYDVEPGTYRLSWKGSGTYACSLIIRSTASGNKFVMSNGKYSEVLEVAEGELGTPCLYLAKNTFDYSGNVCFVQGDTSEYDEETSVVNSFTGVGNVNVSGYVWSKDNENTKVLIAG